MSWEVPPGTLPGTYRLRCFGDYKPWFSRWEGGEAVRLLPCRLRKSAAVGLLLLQKVHLLGR
jgi:hypothetical protein